MLPTATVILPTTAERWQLVECSLGCILGQDTRDLEVFIVGDGVGETSGVRYREWEASDSRVRFFDYPKHARRGESYRHELLINEALGRVVLYCTDRDLWFRHHASTMIEVLERRDFANALAMYVQRSGVIGPLHAFDLRLGHRRRIFATAKAPHGGMPISTVGHTLDAYLRLGEGWSETRRSNATDTYMWQEVLRDTSISATTVARPTVLYFPRDAHPGWPVARRLEELLRWVPLTKTDAGYLECLEAYCAALHADRVKLSEEYEVLTQNHRPIRATLAVWFRHIKRLDLRFGGKGAAIWAALPRTRSINTLSGGNPSARSERRGSLHGQGISRSGSSQRQPRLSCG
jgi:hypothetical protein